MGSKIITAIEAIACLAVEGEERPVVHVFRNPGGMLVGADWDLSDAEEHIRKHGAEVGGSACRGMGHAIVVRPDYFFAHCEKALSALDPVDARQGRGKETG